MKYFEAMQRLSKAGYDADARGYDFEERIAIMQYDAHMTEAEATAYAVMDFVKRKEKQ